MKFILYFSLFTITFTSCSKKVDTEEVLPDLSISEEVTQNKKLEFSISFSNPLINKFFNYIKTSNELPWVAYEEAWNNFNEEEKDQWNELYENNKLELQYFERMPILRNEIFLKGNHARGILTGITHERQNIWTDLPALGFYYVSSKKDPSRSISFFYEPYILGETLLSLVYDLNSFDKKDTNNHVNVQGFTTKKTTYTPQENLHDYYRTKTLTVYTSDSISSSINYIHPILINESAGIVKIEIEMSSSQVGTLIYELVDSKNLDFPDSMLNNSIASERLDPEESKKYNILYQKIKTIIDF